jgi:hypothetical protein
MLKLSVARMLELCYESYQNVSEKARLKVLSIVRYRLPSFLRSFSKTSPDNQPDFAFLPYPIDLPVVFDHTEKPVGKPATGGNIDSTAPHGI